MPTFSIHTYGCQMNVRDSELLARRLRAAGFADAPAEDEADVVLVNSCSVREKAEEKALGKLGMLCAARRERPGLVVGLTGCMANRLGPDVFALVPGLSFSVGPRAAGAAVVDLVRRALAGSKGMLVPDSERGAEDALPAKDAGAGGPPAPASFVTILFGCNQRCSYCIVPFVRGREESRDPRAVLAEVRAEAERGAREITLLGQSVMRYGRMGFAWPDDLPSPMGFTEPLPRLLELLAREVPAIRRLRFTSGHPLGVTPELVRAMREIPAVCAHLHLPMQSGSDRVLKEMRRGYDRARYLDAVRALREGVPDIAITTDVIVGFPGETEEDFELTRSAMEEAAFDNAFVFKYSPRPGTPSAERPDDVPDEEKRRRDQVLLADQDARGQRLNDRWTGRTVEVLADGPSLRNAARWSGRTEQNKIVVFEPVPGLARGDFVQVRIESAHPQTLFGTVGAPCSAP
ncbi:MAG: tRNA (N6-isopentenyl adenosine(37)-C2)-methylthiotransferase MiaB [Kiritimatiellae bacterium]|nr:tRNA (N6-isopentenyl adenosine(37)-C2)-methylthiotransferase MiaB [Kiritimatiellia bacterium]